VRCRWDAWPLVRFRSGARSAGGRCGCGTCGTLL
jgi:hypothetical protein